MQATYIYSCLYTYKSINFKGQLVQKVLFKQTGGHIDATYCFTSAANTVVIVRAGGIIV